MSDRPKQNLKPKAEKDIKVCPKVYNNKISNIPALSTSPQYIVKSLKIMAYNVNGIRAALKKGLDKYIQNQNPDILFIGETKVGQASIQEFIESKEFKSTNLCKNYYYVFSSSVMRQGYSGTAAFIKQSISPLSVQTKFPQVSNDCILNSEGRLIKLEFDKFAIYHIYVPNSGRGEDGFLNERVDVEAQIRMILKSEQKPIIYCGDLNVVAAKIDIFEWQKNLGSPGMTEEERKEHQTLKTELNLVDSFRQLNQELRKYSWFSYFGSGKEGGRGWRIDYFLVNDDLMQYVKVADIDQNAGDCSDHVPIILSIEM
ncbi:Endonuclease/Exonuclease/phosphatase_family protein [Hexamita inflata]|uniref:DNA repair nuclease/redox regulator APEX1 n=1 Tax=Hexamita inflata TaxID=28002 RepID=A0AA86NIN8_9EUKA|nr:Endonuclease/Exonuclease/phosphatase family protein [Hexamita inflata]CAI9920759.1 Endonuclease/Exonuclease/phosphatase family protein [Hexamita inflata]